MFILNDIFFRVNVPFKYFKNALTAPHLCVFRARGDCLLAADDVLFLLNESRNRNIYVCFWMYCMLQCSRSSNSTSLHIFLHFISGVGVVIPKRSG